jgi:NAD-dependent dihydropyrimidine dehydrogenase PreA subunit
MQKHLQNQKSRKHTKQRAEEYVPLGVHGTMLAIDWDSCYADGACIEACPVQVSATFTKSPIILLFASDHQ